MSPLLFNSYSENIFKEIKQWGGIKVGGKNINNIRFADDAVLISDNEQDLNVLLNKVIEINGKWGLDMNLKKTVCMVINKSGTIEDLNIKCGEVNIKQVNNYKYLGSIISNDGKCATDINMRITLAKNAFYKMKNVLTNRRC